jgi:hypothetical protein
MIHDDGRGRSFDDDVADGISGIMAIPSSKQRANLRGTAKITRCISHGIELERMIDKSRSQGGNSQIQ